MTCTSVVLHKNLAYHNKMSRTFSWRKYKFVSHEVGIVGYPQHMDWTNSANLTSQKGQVLIWKDGNVSLQKEGEVWQTQPRHTFAASATSAAVATISHHKPNVSTLARLCIVAQLSQNDSLPHLHNNSISVPFWKPCRTRCHLCDPKPLYLYVCCSGCKFQNSVNLELAPAKNSQHGSRICPHNNLHVVIMSLKYNYYCCHSHSRHATQAMPLFIFQQNGNK